MLRACQRFPLVQLGCGRHRLGTPLRLAPPASVPPLPALPARPPPPPLTPSPSPPTVGSDAKLHADVLAVYNETVTQEQGLSMEQVAATLAARGVVYSPQQIQKVCALSYVC